MSASVIAIVHLAIGFVAGIFAPAIGRKIKTLFANTAKAIDAKVYSDYDTVKTKVENEIKKL